MPRPASSSSRTSADVQRHNRSRQRTLIGVLASHDSRTPNESLVSLFTYLCKHPDRNRLDGFHFVFTGGTYDRVFGGSQHLGVPALDTETARWLDARSTALPSTQEGGVIVLSYLISQRQCSIVWPFFAPNANHWQRHENLAFMRLCDQWHVKRLMNRGSVMAWFDNEAKDDQRRNLQPCPPKLAFPRLGKNTGSITFPPRPQTNHWRGSLQVRSFHHRRKPFNKMTIALIAHDEMKGRMIDFAIDHEAELDAFGTIIATGTTGREVAAATSERISNKMVRLHSGPKGGDIEIATAVLYDKCDVVIFFVDPLRPHPHIEDIRVVFQACMVREHVVMITNEMHAREFMSRVVRQKSELGIYE